MFRWCFIFGLQLLVILICGVCRADKATTSKRVQKCLDYNTLVYGEAVPNCPNSAGDSVIEIQEFPYIAALGYRDGESICWKCHGTLISTRYILAAGHCLKESQPVHVKLGIATTGLCWNTSDSSAYDIDKIIVHPLYNPNEFYYDIGLIKLSRKVEISENIRPICLPDTNLQPDVLFQVNYEKTQTEPPQRLLTKYEHNTVPNENCSVLFEMFNDVEPFHRGLTDDILCNGRLSNTSSKYFSTTATGPPLYIDHPQIACAHIQLGIGSFRWPLSKLPKGAARVFSFADWIESIIWADGEDV